MKTILRWEDPPPAGGPSKTGDERGVSQWSDVAMALMRHPGRSAVLYEGKRQTANNLRNMVTRGVVNCFGPAGDFDAVTRQKVPGDNSIVTVYARYVGSDDE